MVVFYNKTLNYFITKPEFIQEDLKSNRVRPTFAFLLTNPQLRNCLLRRKTISREKWGKANQGTESKALRLTAMVIGLSAQSGEMKEEDDLIDAFVYGRFRSRSLLLAEMLSIGQIALNFYNFVQILRGNQTVN